MKPLSPHWADQAAARIIATRGDKESYTVASGITPSGTVHVGNFREVITVDLVARALRSLGKKVRFVYSWDDFDTLRKVPKNLPEQAMLTENLRRPISRVADPFGHDESYADHNIKEFEAQLPVVGIEPEFLYQSKRYASNLYAEEIKKALEAKDDIKAILDSYRSEPLAEHWLPTAIYCESCARDTMEYERYDGGYDYSYKCSSCGHEATTDIRKTDNIKLYWRVDWPMRWNYEDVDFEPGGKDHSSDGGSYDTGSKIIKQVWGKSAPQYLQYDFVSIKGRPGKMSSSAGDLITLGEAVSVYEPQMLRWIFASHRPNHDFAMAFDSDVIKVYDEFDRAELSALGPKPEKLGKWPLLRRTYELSVIGDIPEKAPYRAPFRELCNRLQVLDGDVSKVKESFYAEHLRTPEDHAAFDLRAARAWTWVTAYAPEEFRFRINTQPIPMDLSDIQKSALEKLKQLITRVDLDTIEGKDLNDLLYEEVIRGVEIEPKDFFQLVYNKLISRDKGPRLPSFLKELGSEKIAKLLV